LSVAENVKNVKTRIEKAALRVGRKPESVTLIAVTKTVGTARIQEALSAGIRHFGENRIQEAKDKIPGIGRAAQWHLIGHLQTNKARQAVALFDRIHSVDSLRVAEALQREAEKKKKRLPVLIQVNIAGEERKSGVEAEGVLDLIQAISKMENLLVEGLMTIPPYDENPEETRPVYKRLREVWGEVKAIKLPRVNMQHLSMGMSHDFETAVEEGATLVRVGTAIFGERTQA